MPILSNAFARFRAQHCAKESLSALPREGPIRPQASIRHFYWILIAPACAWRSLVLFHWTARPSKARGCGCVGVRVRPFVACRYRVVSWMWCAASKGVVPLPFFGIGHSGRHGCAVGRLQLSPVSATSSVHTVFVTDCGGAHDLMAEVIAYSFVRAKQVKAWPP